MKYVSERRMAGAPGAAASNVSSSHPRTKEAVASIPRIQELKMSHRLKANRPREDIEKTEHSIAALQEHLRRMKLQLLVIGHGSSSQCDNETVVPLLDRSLFMETFCESFQF